MIMDLFLFFVELALIIIGVMMVLVGFTTMAIGIGISLITLYAMTNSHFRDAGLTRDAKVKKSAILGLLWSGAILSSIGITILILI